MSVASRSERSTFSSRFGRVGCRGRCGFLEGGAVRDTKKRWGGLLLRCKPFSLSLLGPNKFCVLAGGQGQGATSGDLCEREPTVSMTLYVRSPLGSSKVAFAISRSAAEILSYLSRVPRAPSPCPGGPQGVVLSYRRTRARDVGLSFADRGQPSMLCGHMKHYFFAS
jgi:hypothetical protein